MANSTIASSNNVSRPLSKHSNQKHLSTLISSLSTLTFEYEYESEFFLPFEYEYCEFESNTLIFESEYDLVEPLAVCRSTPLFTQGGCCHLSGVEDETLQMVDVYQSRLLCIQLDFRAQIDFLI